MGYMAGGSAFKMDLFGQIGHFFANLTNTASFPPRWHCGSGWNAFTGWLYILSDIAIWSAYFTIPLVLAIFLKRRKDMPFPRVIWLFAAFIFACGLTHLLDAVMFWWPAYRLTALVYFVTGVVSWVTVFALIPVISEAIKLRTPAEMERQVKARTAELEHAMAMAKRNEDRFRRIMDANIIGLFFCTMQGQIFEANQAFLSVIGYTQQDVEKGILNWRHLTPSEFASQDEAIVQSLLRTGVSGLFEKQYFHKQGHRVDLLLSVATLDESDEQTFVVTALDITQQKNYHRALKITEEHVKALNAELEEKVHNRTAQLEEANQQMQLAYKELESFSYSVSHDLRSPLRSLDGFSTILLNDYADKLDDNGKDYLNRIRNNSQKMGDLINHLLRLSQVTRADIHKQRVNASVLCQDIIKERQRETPDRRVEIIVQPDVYANADPVLLRCVLENLLSNAWKFTQHKSPAYIEFGQYNVEGRAIYFVKDNGVGFDMAYAGKLFGVFQRLHSHDEFKGTGIGLATVQRIINRHGGTIWVEAEPNKGAIFMFTL